MKKKVFILGVSVLLLCGCGKTIPTLSNGDEAVVTFENGDKISVNDLYKKIKNDYALQALISMVDTQILEKEYASEIEAKKQTAESTVKAMKEQYGDTFLSMLQNYGYSSVDAYQDFVYLNSLQSLAILDYGKSKVTDKEVQKYYDESSFGDITVRHILVTPKVTDSMSSDEKKAAEQKAKDTITTIIDELKKSENAKDRFAELAKQYSEDTKTKENGGSLGSINVGTLDTNYDELVKSANKLKDNTYSTELITTELGYHVIFRESQKEKPSFDDIKDSIRESLANKKLTADNTMSITALQELRKKYGMDIVDDEIQKQYGNYITNTIAAIEKEKNSKEE